MPRIFGACGLLPGCVPFAHGTSGYWRVAVSEGCSRNAMELMQ